jgi:hypothetical protein
MDLSRIPIGHNPPHEVNLIIEIPQGGASRALSHPLCLIAAASFTEDMEPHAFGEVLKPIFDAFS